MNKQNYTIDIKEKFKLPLEFLHAQIERFYAKLIDKAPDYENHLIHFIVGGDGTLLSALQKYDFSGRYIIIKESGSLGFYSEFNKLQELEDIYIDNIEEEEFHPLILKTKKRDYYAANEILLVNSENIVVFNLTFNDMIDYKCRSSGLIMVSQMGSTGLNLSSGGPILMNQNAIYMKLIAPSKLETGFNKMGSCVLDITHNVKAKILRGSFDVIVDGKKMGRINKEMAVFLSSPKAFDLIHFDSNFLSKRFNRL